MTIAPSVSPSVALVRAEPAQLARATIAHHSKSFALASRLLGARLRDQTAVVYAWCRRVDDAIDEPAINGASRPDELRVRSRDVLATLDNEPGVAGASRLDEPRVRSSDVLAMLDDELVAAYAGRASDPVLAAFGEVARARRIPIIYPRELLAGMAMDVAGTEYASVPALIQYAYRVAGVVGLMMCHVFGVKRDSALVHAAHLGIAMQLTNICRDVEEDRRRGRVYVPADLVAAHGSAGAVRELLAIADRYYRSADEGIRALPFRAAIAVRAARRIYAAIGGEIARRNHDVTAGRAVVSSRRKWLLAASSVRLVERGRAAIPLRILELRDVPLA